MSTGAEILELLARALHQAKLPHALIGGHGVNAYLEPRFTADIDLTVKADLEAISRFRRELENAGYHVTSEYGADLPSGPDFVRLARAATDPPIEIQAAKTRFQGSVIARAQPTPRGPAVATREDLIVLKLIANRSKDLADLAGLVRLPGLDWEYLARWAREWEVFDRLTRVREDP